MRSEKDEIARLKAENVALQQKLVSAAESLRPAAVKLPASDPRDVEISTLKSELAKSIRDLEVFKKNSLEELKLLSEQSASVIDAQGKLISDISAKIECINALKIRNTFLEAENAMLSERALTAEALSR